MPTRFVRWNDLFFCPTFRLNRRLWGPESGPQVHSNSIKDDEQVVSDVNGRDSVGSPMNCEYAGPDGPLIFDFLSLAKLEERCSADNDRFRGHRVIISETIFDCNPLGTAAAFGLRNRLVSTAASCI
ncbi:hypothetical protein Y032_0075g969 [Ancylostoma ceylanicum]|uniref:Uncharacterized protein n=1 Tax=Ancylostoma ceylanicum TaxID=53326 RepID=A0A016TVE0_9BILA|nr:hypothetical protein Y032_0075g969 [Ancylostoma ceylanicum]